MKVLLDTNILLRLSEPASPHHRPAVTAVRHLAADGRTFCIGSQTIAEFLAVATRPVKDRGLGMDQGTADAELSKLVTSLDVLYDSASAVVELRRLIVAHGVSGKSVHDARLVAAMIVNGVPDILTFNGVDFVRYPQVNVVDPLAIVMK